MSRGMFLQCEKSGEAPQKSSHTPNGPVETFRTSRPAHLERVCTGAPLQPHVEPEAPYTDLFRGDTQSLLGVNVNKFAPLRLDENKLPVLNDIHDFPVQVSGIDSGKAHASALNSRRDTLKSLLS